MKKINVRLFGSFKKYVPGGNLEIQIGDRCTVKEAKTAIHDHLVSAIPEYGDAPLVFESALATDNEILNEESALVTAERLALLPPVCGG